MPTINVCTGVFSFSFKWGHVWAINGSKEVVRGTSAVFVVVVLVPPALPCELVFLFFFGVLVGTVFSSSCCFADSEDGFFSGVNNAAELLGLAFRLDDAEGVVDFLAGAKGGAIGEGSGASLALLHKPLQRVTARPGASE